MEFGLRSGKRTMISHHLGKQLIFDFFKSFLDQDATHNGLSCKASVSLGKKTLLQPFKFPVKPYEYKVVALRECPTPEALHICDTPDKAAEYWKMNVTTNPFYNSECECLGVLILNTRRKVKGHHLVATGTMDTLLVHPREIFRLAVITCAAAIVIAHNHPSGDPSPSEADIKITRDLIRAGQLLKIDVLDHVIIGQPRHSSLRELGYFF